MATILIIDDDSDFSFAMSSVLTANGYKVETAFDGESGYLAAKKNAPDLILLDVMLTYDSEGFDIARRINEDPQTTHIPVILITSMREAMGLSSGPQPDSNWLPVKKVLEKPVKSDILLHHIAEILA